MSSEFECNNISSHIMVKDKTMKFSQDMEQPGYGNRSVGVPYAWHGPGEKPWAALPKGLPKGKHAPPLSRVSCVFMDGHEHRLLDATMMSFGFVVVTLSLPQSGSALVTRPLCG